MKKKTLGRSFKRNLDQFSYFYKRTKAKKIIKTNYRVIRSKNYQKFDVTNLQKIIFRINFYNFRNCNDLLNVRLNVAVIKNISQRKLINVAIIRIYFHKI